jgi:hypothetical protein
MMTRLRAGAASRFALIMPGARSFDKNENLSLSAAVSIAVSRIALSRLQTLSPSSFAAARICISTNPSPWPESLCASINARTSGCLAMVAEGKSSNRCRISRRGCKCPHANSPITSGWHTASPASNKDANPESECRK